MTSFRNWVGRRILGGAQQKHAASLKQEKPLYVVVGFPRSGTSLVCQLLADAGVYFGRPEDLLPEDIRNPKGYFEHQDVLRLSRRFLREAGAPNDLIADSLRSRGWRRATRLFTRRAMIQTIDRLFSQAIGAVGMKLFPLFLYAWQPYVPPSTKLIVIYRDPLAVIPSFLSAWPGGIFTISSVLELWTRSHRELLAFLATYPGSVIVRYEDLLDPELRSGVLGKLSQALGLTLNAGVIDTALNRSKKKRADIPLPLETVEMIKALDSQRI